MTATSKLLDSRQIQEEYGLKRAVAETAMCQVPVVRLPNVRKRYVWRADFERYLAEHTRAD